MEDQSATHEMSMSAAVAVAANRRKSVDNAALSEDMAGSSSPTHSAALR